MLNIINEQKHWDDHRRIRAVSCKVKYIKEEGKPILLGNELLATVSHAFYRTTFQYDEKGRLNIEQGTRKEVVDLTIRLPKTSNLTRIDVDKFFEAFQAALDEFETSLFPK